LPAGPSYHGASATTSASPASENLLAPGTYATVAFEACPSRTLSVQTGARWTLLPCSHASVTAVRVATAVRLEHVFSRRCRRVLLRGHGCRSRRQRLGAGWM
jgi:hypothetical protein